MSDCFNPFDAIFSRGDYLFLKYSCNNPNISNEGALSETCICKLNFGRLHTNFVIIQFSLTKLI